MRLRSQFEAGRVQGKFCEVLAGRALHLLQALERKAVEHCDEAAGEVTGRVRGSEDSLGDTTGHQGGEVVLPWVQ